MTGLGHSHTLSKSSLGEITTSDSVWDKRKREGEGERERERDTHGD
jgi:hypothetical protein